MNFALLLTSFLSGILTVLAPCVLPILPVILGGTLGDKNKWRPLVIAVALASSVVVFTLLLKVFTLFINIPQEFWRYFSGTIILLFGLFLLLPEFWDFLSIKLNFTQSSEGLMQKAQGNRSLWGSVLLGASLGPVFSSCSPTYFVILATVLPVSFGAGLVYLLVYAVGLALILLAIGYLGQFLTKKLKFAANPRGFFKRALGVLLVLVGLGIVSGLEKALEEKLQESGFGATTLEQDLLKRIDMLEPLTQPAKSAVDEEIVKMELPNYGPAPELVGLQNWINSNSLTLADLRGKVVMIDFWTYSCINCIRTLPYLETWHEKYSDQGLVIIGVHAPEFQFEKKIENVQKAVNDRGLKYAVVQDNDFATWRAYNNRYWPAKYIIDQKGDLRYYHFGEGEYEQTEKVINQLLGMDGKDLVASKVVTEKSASKKLTPETYLGLERRARQVKPGEVLQHDEWRLDGKWKEDEEKVVSAVKGASHSLNFSAVTANLVIGGKGTAKVMVDGKLLTENAGADVKNGLLNVDGERLYRLTDFGSNYAEHTIELIFDQAGIELYAWTFG